MPTSTERLALHAGARSLITDAEFADVTATVQDNNPDMAADVAERIVEEALKFMAACAVTRGGGLNPSRVVDEGWHALILHTGVYARLCERLGRFVHHVPERADPIRHDPAALDRTQQAIVDAGYEPDLTLWPAPTDESIPVSANCEHSPPGPNGSCTGDCSNSGPN
ncbi:hypothetical protein ABZW18_15345 [Streptomyces sp. NPDC004647]|uniref:glycine-rich domain-containing protein n=1 Tax=Streptomyces sp. NPDC004647 TaxID=3154671 RepID=UPI0033A1AA4A